MFFTVAWDFFKRSGAVILDKGMKHRNCTDFLQMFTEGSLNLILCLNCNVKFVLNRKSAKL